MSLSIIIGLIVKLKKLPKQKAQINGLFVFYTVLNSQKTIYCQIAPCGSWFY